VCPHIAKQRQNVVEPHSRRELPEREPVAAVQGEDKGKWPDEMRGDPEQDPSFTIRLEHQTKIAGLEVAQAAMDQAARARAGAGPEIILFDQYRSQTAHRRVSSHSRSGDATADDQDVGRLRGQLVRRGAH
jgi:hypothetical protein